jgi:hypothetical protein
MTDDTDLSDYIERAQRIAAAWTPGTPCPELDALRAEVDALPPLKIEIADDIWRRGGWALEQAQRHVHVACEAYAHARAHATWTLSGSWDDALSVVLAYADARRAHVTSAPWGEGVLVSLGECGVTWCPRDGVTVRGPTLLRTWREKKRLRRDKSA